MQRTLFTAALLILVLAYAVVRYVVVKGVAWAHLPLYVGNKAVSVVALVLLGLAVVAPKDARWLTRRWAGRAGLAFAGLHLLMTVPVLSPALMGGLYRSGSAELTAAAEMALLLGSVALLAVLVQAFAALEARLAQGQRPRWFRPLGWAAVVLATGHCAVLGWSGWWDPGAWPGGLPPVTLLAAAFGAGTAAAGVVRR